MKKIFIIFVASSALSVNANASRDSDFKREIERGLPRIEIEYTAPESDTVVEVVEYGVAPASEPAIDMVEVAPCDVVVDEIEQEIVYEPEPVAEEPETPSKPAMKLFVPTPMYVRMGGGLNLGMATKKARVGDDKFKAQKSWNTTIGLGWNILSFLRTEVAFQESRFEFKDISGLYANYHTLNGMVYFDLPPRYEYRGDSVYRRSFVPFIGVGGGIGGYDFVGAHGADGLVVIAPRAELGMNFMINDVIGIDIAYQYQMFLGHGFGWNTKRNGLDGVSNIMATIRANF